MRTSSSVHDLLYSSLYVVLHHVLLVSSQLVSAITNKLGVQDAPLPQELNEGVDSDEWVHFVEAHSNYI